MKKVKFDYRHIFCIFITIGFILCSIFVFPYAFGRLTESLRDFGLSVAYYFTELFEFGSGIMPTITNFSEYPFVMPFGLPETWEEFQVAWSNYWVKWASKENFNGYLEKLGDIAYVISQILLLVIPFILLVVMLFKRYFETENNDYNQDSKALKFFKNLATKFSPVKRWIKGFCAFIKEHKPYWALWLWIWAFNFNIITIFLEFLAYYFYFVVSFDFVSLYIQVLKLLCDLSPMIDFIPVFIWVIIGLVIFHLIRKKIALRKLNHMERKNRGFINSRPIVFMACGTMGKKKTTMITDIALSQNVMLRNKAFEKIFENDLKFPYFPWINLENVLRLQMENHVVYSLATTKKFIRTLKSLYLLSIDNPECKKYIRRNIRRKFGFDFENLLFDYDYERYGLTYDDKLKVVDIWEVIETYSQLYFIYVIQSSYIQSNYAIRTDNVISDLGNFPLWDTDFFERDSRLMDSYSRYSHILDFDMLRLGRKVIENNKNANAFEFGVVVITEIGKERGNNLENQDKKKKDEGTNQKNDLFNSWLKMVRHSATVDNYPFVRVITDDQRPTSWGADARDLCDIIHIKESSETKLAMPFFTLEELLYEKIFSKFKNLYYRYRYVRSDNTVPMWLLKKITAKINHYYTGIYNRFGYSRLTVQVENGTMDGQITEYKYFLINKKIYSKVFSSDCHSDFFMKKALRSEVGLNDLVEFKSEKATLEELIQENAYFMKDILFGLKNDDKE